MTKYHRNRFEESAVNFLCLFPQVIFAFWSRILVEFGPEPNIRSCAGSLVPERPLVVPVVVLALVFWRIRRGCRIKDDKR